MSGPRAPTPSAQPPFEQIMQQQPQQQPLRRQLPFSSLKPPFAAPAEYHRFSDPRVGAADHGAEAIVVKSPVSSSYFCFGKIYAFIFE
jgi:transcription factor E2F3